MLPLGPRPLWRRPAVYFCEQGQPRLLVLFFQQRASTMAGLLRLSIRTLVTSQLRMSDQLGHLGKGAGKGGGGGGSIREAGGSMGKKQAAEEEMYFKRKEQEQLAALKQHHEDEIDHHKKEIERLQREIDRHKGKIRKLKHDD